VFEETRSLRASSVRLTGLLLFAALAFPTLISLHQSPQSVFWSEWFAPFLLLAALGIRVSDRDDAAMNLPLAGLAFVALALALALRLAVEGGGMGWPVYLLLLVLAMPLGCDRRFSAFIASGLLGCALLQSLAGLLQLMGLELGGLVMTKLFRLAFGNIGQANHYANLIWLGLGAALYLFQTRRLAFPVFAVIAVWLALASAASASRGVWLYTAAFALLALWAKFKGGAAMQRAFVGGLVILVASVGAQLAVSYGHLLDVFNVTSSLNRVGDASSNGQRLHDWAIAWQAARAHPWWGAGIGSFYSLTVEAAIAGPEKAFPMLAEHAHDLPLHLAAEQGFVVALLICGGFALWFLRQMVRPATPERLLALCGLAVIGLHSLVEYPLWYSYFIIPAGLFFGLAAADPAEVRIGLPRGLVHALVLIAFATQAWIMVDWRTVQTTSSFWNQKGRELSAAERAKLEKNLASVSRYSLFSDEARNQQMIVSELTAATVPAFARQCDARWTHKPDWTVMIDCAVAYAATNQNAPLDRVVLTLCRGFPQHHALLREWIDDAPELGGLAITGRACLK
jgi:O-antigen ligase